MRISDWSSDVCSSDLQSRIDPRLFPALSSQALRFFHRPAIRHGGMVGLAGGRLARDSAGHRHGLHDRRPPPPGTPPVAGRYVFRSEEHTSELQSLMRISYAVFCLKKKKQKTDTN